MKALFVLSTLALFCLGACTERTCPTYSKDNIKKPIAKPRVDWRV
ncbi:hypothetical protein [Xanthovirga aplysinae]|nr:hypothetical protein [Xanthovirga aplysinae]